LSAEGFKKKRAELTVQNSPPGDGVSIGSPRSRLWLSATPQLQVLCHVLQLLPEQPTTDVSVDSSTSEKVETASGVGVAESDNGRTCTSTQTRQVPNYPTTTKKQMLMTFRFESLV